LKPVATPKAKVFVSMLAGIKISSLKEVWITNLKTDYKIKLVLVLLIVIL
jgi:hypothetical protein